MSITTIELNLNLKYGPSSSDYSEPWIDALVFTGFDIVDSGLALTCSSIYGQIELEQYSDYQSTLVAIQNPSDTATLQVQFQNEDSEQSVWTLDPDQICIIPRARNNVGSVATWIRLAASAGELEVPYFVFGNSNA